MTAHDHMHGDTAASWDEHAAQYAIKAEGLEPLLQAATEAMLDAVELRPGMRLLDLGCGVGHSTAAAVARKADALGIDRSPAMIDAARERHPELRFAVGEMRSPPPGPWDAVVCRFAGHHVDPAWIEQAHRVLRPGGRLAIAEVEHPHAAPDHDGKVGPAEWRRRFEQAGFTEVRSEPCAIGHGWPPTWIIAGRKPEVSP